MAEATYEDQKFLEYILHALVDNPSEVRIERTVDDLGVFLKVYVAKEDMGKIIGKQGRTADAIKILLRVLGAKQNLRVNMKIVDPEKEGMEGDAPSPMDGMDIDSPEM